MQTKADRLASVITLFPFLHLNTASNWDVDDLSLLIPSWYFLSVLLLCVSFDTPLVSYFWIVVFSKYNKSRDSFISISGDWISHY
jgi:hypothetical protein